MQVTSIKLDEISNFASLQINLNGVIDLGEGIRVADGASLLRHQVRDSFCAHKDLPHFAQLVLGLLWGDTVNSKATLGVVDQMEILSGLVDADHIPKTSGGGCISSDLAIALNEPLHAGLLYIVSRQDVLKSVPQGHDEWETFSQLVGTGRWPRSKHAGQFIQHPMLWSCYTLQMLLGTRSHGCAGPERGEDVGILMP